MGGQVDPEQICQVHTATSSYTLDLSYPVSYPDQKALTGYLTQRRDEFVDFVESTPVLNRAAPYQLVATGTAYRSGTRAAGTQSVVIRVGEEAGAHPDTTVKALNYDLSTHAPITFDALFKPGSKPLDIVYPAVRSELQKHWGTETLPPLRGGLDVDTHQNFAITDDAVIFFFSQDQLLGQNEGPLEVSVPRTELVSLLA